MSKTRLSQPASVQSTLARSRTAIMPQWFSRKRMLVLVLLPVLLLLLLLSTALAEPGDDFPDEPIAPISEEPIPVAPTFVKFPNNTACFTGQSLRDLRPDLTNKWYTGIEIDTSLEGLHIFSLVASNCNVIGTGYALVLGNHILVNFVINGTPESDAFHSFVNSIANEPNQGSDTFQTGIIPTIRTDLVHFNENAVGDPKHQFGRNGDAAKFDTNTALELYDRMFGNQQTSPNSQTSQEGLSTPASRLQAANQFLSHIGGLSDDDLYAGTGSEPSQYQFRRRIANGVEILGGFVTLFKDPNQLTEVTMDGINTVVSNIKQNVPTALPPNSVPFGQFIDITDIAGDSPLIWFTAIELVTYQSNSHAISDTWNSSQLIQQP